MASLLDILSFRNISTAVQRVETGIPDRLPPVFHSLTEDVIGDRTTYVEFFGQRQIAKRAEYGAPSRARTLRPLGERPVALLHFNEHVKIRQELILNLRNYNDAFVMKMAQQEIARHGADFRQLFDNNRTAAIIQMLSYGKLWYGSTGALQQSSSNAVATIDYAIPANNQNQLNGIIDASWATTSTNIIQHLENIRVQMKKNTGRDLKHAFYGKAVANYVFKNDTIKAYWQYNSAMYDSFKANPGVIPQGFAGLVWHPMGESFYASDNDAPTDTVVSLWPDDVVTFTPEIDRNVYTLYQGSIPVPKSFQVAGDAQAAVSNFETVYGMGGYAVPELDPVGIKEIYFDTMLPAWKNPYDMFIADVVP